MFSFPLTRPAATAVLLLTVTAILAIISSQEFDEAHYKSLGSGYSYAYLETPFTERFFPTRNLLECAALSLNSQSEFFTYNKVSHVCKNYSPEDIMTVVSTNDKNEISFYRNSKWIKVYALSMGAGSKVYDSFMNIGNTSSWKVDKCNGTFCPNFFRHPLLDFWNDLPIDEVKLVINKNQTSVVTMIFDGRFSTLESWFSHNRLESSPWNDLSSTMPLEFSIKGFKDVRRFYITNHEGCPIESGWLAIDEGSLYCLYTKKGHYPSIRYSDTNSKIVWNNGHALADSLAIFIRLWK